MNRLENALEEWLTFRDVELGQIKTKRKNVAHLNSTLEDSEGSIHDDFLSIDGSLSDILPKYTRQVNIGEIIIEYGLHVDDESVEFRCEELDVKLLVPKESLYIADSHLQYPVSLEGEEGESAKSKSLIFEKKKEVFASSDEFKPLEISRENLLKVYDHMWSTISATVLKYRPS